jgi:hypothetical protein
VVCLLQGPSFVASLKPPRDVGSDFFQDWASARNYLAGLPLYASHRQTIERHLGYSLASSGADGVQVDIDINAHPPTSVLLALPLAGLDYPEATLVWNLLSLGALGVSLWLIARQLRIAVSLWSLAPLVTLLLICNPFRQQVLQGQFNLILLLLLTATWVADRSERAALAGIWLGMATVVKLFPGFLLLYFAVRRQWKVLLSAALTMIALTALTAAVFGLQTYRSYVAEILPQVEQFRSSWVNASLPGFWIKLFDPATATERVEPLWRSSRLAQIGAALSGVVVSILVAQRALRARTRRDKDLAFGLAVVGMLLVSPVTWDHYFLLLILPGLLLWLELPPSNLLRAALMVVIAVLCTHPALFWNTWIPGGFGKGMATPWQALLVLSLQCYALVALFVLMFKVSCVKGMA